MYRVRNLSTSATVLFCAALMGCSGEPSSSEVENAIKANVDQSNQQSKKILQRAEERGVSLGSDKDLIVVHKAKKVGCASAEGATGFNCDVELDVSAPFVGRAQKVATIRFVKGSEGWQVVE